MLGEFLKSNFNLRLRSRSGRDDQPLNVVCKRMIKVKKEKKDKGFECLDFSNKPREYSSRVCDFSDTLGPRSLKGAPQSNRVFSDNDMQEVFYFEHPSSGSKK